MVPEIDSTMALTDMSRQDSERQALLDLVDLEGRQSARTAIRYDGRRRLPRPWTCAVLAIAGIVAVIAVAGSFPGALQASSSSAHSEPFISLAGKDGTPGQGNGPPGQDQQGPQGKPGGEESPTSSPSGRGKPGGESPKIEKRGGQEHGTGNSNSDSKGNGNGSGKGNSDGKDNGNGSGKGNGKGSGQGAGNSNSDGKDNGKGSGKGNGKGSGQGAGNSNSDSKGNGKGSGKDDHPEKGNGGGGDGGAGGLLGTIAAEFHDVPGCVQNRQDHHGHGKGKQDESKVEQVEDCIGGVIEDHTQKGMVVPLEEFDVPKPTTGAWIFSILTVGLFAGSLIAVSIYGIINNQNTSGNRYFLFFLPDTCRQCPKLALSVGGSAVFLFAEIAAGEHFLSVVQPWFVAAIAIPVSLHAGGKVPALLGPILIGLPALRSLAIDYQLYKAESSGKKAGIMDFVTLLSSKLEVVDATSDGLALATIFLLEAQDNQAAWHARISAAWGDGPAALFLPIMGQTHGLSFAMALALLTPFAFAAWTASLRDSEVLKAQLAGLGMTGKFHASKQQATEVQFAAGFGTLVRMSLEAVPQMFLQGTAVMVAGQGLSSQPSLAFSMAMSWTTGSLAMFKIAMQGLKMQSNKEPAERFAGGFLVVTSIPTLLVLTFSVLRVFSAELCESKLWNVSTGCVTAPGMQ